MKKVINEIDLRKIIVSMIKETKEKEITADTKPYREYAKSMNAKGDLIKTDAELISFIKTEEGEKFLEERYGKKGEEQREYIDEMIKLVKNKKGADDMSSFRIEMMVKGLIHTINAYLVNKKSKPTK